MKMLLIPLVLAAVGQPGGDPEKLFRAMEEKIARADAVQYSFESTMDGGGLTGKGKGKLTYAQGGRARLDLDVDLFGKAMKLEMVSDGTKLRAAVDGQQPMAQDTPKVFRKMLDALTATAGTFTGMMMGFGGGPGARQEEELLKKLKPSDFKLGKLELVDGRETQIVEYKVSFVDQPDTATCQVWISTQTGLPVRRTLQFNAGGNASKITETYSDFRLNPVLDDKMFVVPQ